MKAPLQRDFLIGCELSAQDIALLHAEGTVNLVTRTGRMIKTIRVGPARAVSLRPGRLAVLRRHGRLYVYATATGQLLDSWPVPAGTSKVDMQFGIALLTAGRSVYALDVVRGRMVRVLRAPSAVMAQLEAPGVAFVSNTAGRGHIRFLPIARIQAELR
jgi:hypothetical protein